MGATNSEIKRINDSINQLVNRAQIKQEDMSDKISLLKKIEVKFQHLVEMRKVFNFFDPQTLYRKEKDIRDRIADENIANNRKREEDAWEAQAAKTRKNLERKVNLKVSKPIRDTRRSKNVEVKVRTTKTEKIRPEVEEMRRYLGHMPDNWESEMFPKQSSVDSPATEK